MSFDKSGMVGYAITGFVGSMLNTIFYLGALWLLASNVVTTYYGIDVSGVGAMVMTVATTAGIPEAIVSCIVVAAVSKALSSPYSSKQNSGGINIHLTCIVHVRGECYSIYQKLL